MSATPSQILAAFDAPTTLTFVELGRSGLCSRGPTQHMLDTWAGGWTKEESARVTMPPVYLVEVGALRHKAELVASGFSSGRPSVSVSTPGMLSRFWMGRGRDGYMRFATGYYTRSDGLYLLTDLLDWCHYHRTPKQVRTAWHLIQALAIQINPSREADVNTY